MPRVLLTGASGFIASHILDVLLSHGHSVRITVRSADKAARLIAAHPEHAHRIDYVIVRDIADPAAFDDAVRSEVPFDAVIHTASPVSFDVEDVKRDLIDPAVNGTMGIIRAVHQYAPTVRRVVITSSFAALVNGHGNQPEKVYTEEDWNGITEEEALENPVNGYRGAKTFAERKAWEFVEEEKPGFTLATILPPMAFGPIKTYLNTAENINMSNGTTRDILNGAAKKRGDLGPDGIFLWVDVRDIAEAHVRAMEKEEAGGKRFFVVCGNYSKQLIADAVVKRFPEYADKLPPRVPNDGFPVGGVYRADNSRSVEILGLTYRTLEESIGDLVLSLKEVGL